MSKRSQALAALQKHLERCHYLEFKGAELRGIKLIGGQWEVALNELLHGNSWGRDQVICYRPMSLTGSFCIGLSCALKPNHLYKAKGIFMAVMSRMLLLTGQQAALQFASSGLV